MPEWVIFVLRILALTAGHILGFFIGYKLFFRRWED